MSLIYSPTIPFTVDLGGSSLVNLENYSLPHEPTPRKNLTQSTDMLTFSGDKNLGGPPLIPP